MKNRIRKGIFLLICSFPMLLSAQTSVRITGNSRLFEEGKQMFVKQNYSAAIPPLEEFIATNNDASLQQEVEYMLIVAKYKLGDIDRIALLDSYLNRHPDTPYLNDINALFASAYFFNEEYDKAIAYYNGVDFDGLSGEMAEDNVYRFAVSCLKTKNYELATGWFKVLQQKSKKYSVDSQYYLSYILYTQKRYEEAINRFKTLESNPKYADLVAYYIASSYYFLGDYNKSINVAEQYLQFKSNYKSQNLEMNRILAESNYALNQYDKAIKNFNICINNGKALNRSALYKLGMSYYKLAIYSKAVDAFGAAANGDDELAQNAYLNLGLTYLNLSDRTNARMAFQQASAMNYDGRVREKAMYNYALNIHETSFSAFGESVNVFETFLQEYPNSIYADKVSDYLAELYMNTRSYESALSSINRIVNPSTRILEAKQKILFQLGIEAFTNQNYILAIDNFTQSLSLGQYNSQTKAEATYWRGEAYYRLGDFVEAGRSFRNFLSIVPSKRSEMYALAFYNLGYISFNDKRYEEAESLFATFTEHTTGYNRLALADAYNRRGDCFLQKRSFVAAKGNYTRALNTDANVGDYSLYQLALVEGLQKNYNKKIELINRLVKEYPTSPYIPQSQYEEGRSYVQTGQNNRAIEVFNRLISKYPSSPYSRKATAEIALLYYQDGNYNEAIRIYKSVLEQYPGSEEARMAMKDLRSIYVDLNKIEEYAAIANSVPGGIKLQVTEQDSLTYIAAEKRFLNNNNKEAKVSFENYLTNYPNGAFSLNAHYYLAVLNNKEGDDNAVIYHTDELLKFPENPYYEEGLMMQSEIYYTIKDYEKSLDLFKILAAKTSSKDRIEFAQIGRLHSAVFLKQTDEIIDAATAVLKIAKLTPEVRMEALYYRGKALLLKGDNQAALKDLKEVSLDTRTLYGAESKYLVADIYFRAKKYAESEKELLQFIEVSTPHSYWLARGFILLSDVYVAEGKELQARQYLLSLQQNYQGDVEISNLITERLAKLKTEVEE